MDNYYSQVICMIQERDKVSSVCISTHPAGCRVEGQGVLQPYQINPHGGILQHRQDVQPEPLQRNQGGV